MTRVEGENESQNTSHHTNIIQTASEKQMGVRMSLRMQVIGFTFNTECIGKGNDKGGENS